jgi:CheY-like chemotaxis protein
VRTPASPSQPPPTPSRTVSPADQAKPDRGWLLLAEDNAVNQRVATCVLQKLGFRVDVVSDGAEAVEAVSHNSYDAVLMDLQMPVMDGYEAVRRIRAAETPQEHLPIIALTAHAMAGDRERALQDGLDDYICKPVRPADLATVLDRWVGRTAASSPDPDDSRRPGSRA